MSYLNSSKYPSKAVNLVFGLILLAGAGVVFYFTADLISQAFHGSRPITDQELLGLNDPVPGDNYVAFTPSRPHLDTGLQWGRKNNPGTKFLLLAVGDRLMLCSVKIANDGPTFIGRLHQI